MLNCPTGRSWQKGSPSAQNSFCHCFATQKCMTMEVRQQYAMCPGRGWLQKQGLAEDAQPSICSLWWTPRARVSSWMKQAESSASAAAVSVRPLLCPLFLLQEPFPPLLCLFICLLGCHCRHFKHVVISEALLFPT